MTRASSACPLAVVRLGLRARATLDWVKVTEKAGWRPRDSNGDAVFKDQLGFADKLGLSSIE